jgi:formylglycine-generating enzyme required for sulfatase activity
MPAPEADDTFRFKDHDPDPEPKEVLETRVPEARHTPESHTAPPTLDDRATFKFPPRERAEPRDASLTVYSGPLPTIAGYEFLGVLGRGAMGIVYKARHLALKRIVALKMVLVGGNVGPRDLARFRIEGEAVARLQHPNIVQIHEIGETGGHPYCSLEYVAGGNLADRINGKPMPARDSARLVEALARAMQLAHSRNVVHRDLKPANILLAADGTPKITDFGLARQTDSDSDATQAGTVIGTPSYMAPEQAAGFAHEAGPAADIYALGAILYDCITGRPPFKGTSVVETLDQVRTQEPVSPSRWQTNIPLDLETICLKCLRKEPENRYASAAELADDLVRYQQGEPILARPAGRVERAVKWVKRNPFVSGAAVAVVLALAAGTTVSYLKYLDAEKQKGIALLEADKAKMASEFLVSIFQISERDVQGGNVTARQILADAERRIPVEFADQPELRGELVAVIRKVKRGIGRRSPQALILKVSGKVQLQTATGVNKAAVAQALLRLDDRLTLSADARVQLVFLSDFHKEWLKPGREATIDWTGCNPVDAVLERDNSLLMTFVSLPKGTFYKGWHGENKAVKTEIKEDFEIAVHDVTQGQWEAVMGNNPSHFHLQNLTGSGKDVSEEELKLFPVESVSWDDAQEFIRKLNEKERGRGYLYRLPTDAEWEYACRGGATSEEECSHHFYFDKPTDDLSPEQANFNGNGPYGKAPKGQNLGRPTRVGAYPANKLGICDMHGNVFEWCANGDDINRIYRGGCWRHVASVCRAGDLYAIARSMRVSDVGFRLARVPSGGK